MLSGEPWTCVATKLGRLTERGMHRLLAEYGVSVGQFMALREVAQHPGIHRAELGRALHVTPQAASGVIGQLLNRGLLSRTSPEPGLPIKLSLTTAGRELVCAAEPAVEALGRQMLLRCVRPDKVPTMDGAFRHVLQRLSTASEPAPGTDRNTTCQRRIAPSLETDPVPKE